jgi:hypothetical protein
MQTGFPDRNGIRAAAVAPMSLSGLKKFCDEIAKFLLCKLQKEQISMYLLDDSAISEPSPTGS